MNSYTISLFNIAGLLDSTEVKVKDELKFSDLVALDWILSDGDKITIKENGIDD